MAYKVIVLEDDGSQRAIDPAALMPLCSYWLIDDPSKRAFALDRSIHDGKEFVFHNGQCLVPGIDYQISAAQTLQLAADFPLSGGDRLWIRYWVS